MCKTQNIQKQSRCFSTMDRDSQKSKHTTKFSLNCPISDFKKNAIFQVFKEKGSSLWIRAKQAYSSGYIFFRILSELCVSRLPSPLILPPQLVQPSDTPTLSASHMGLRHMCGRQWRKKKQNRRGVGEQQGFS